jgi:antitoxin component YwqK of YwqJK toxin-antitoxin module
MEIVDQLARKYSPRQGYVFTSCDGVWIVVLKQFGFEYLCLKSKFNCDILNQISKFFEKTKIKESHYTSQSFNADKLLVVDIVHKFDTEKRIDKITSSYYFSRNCEYKIGSIKICDLNDYPYDYLIKSNYYYFKSAERAYFDELKGLFRDYYYSACINLYYTGLYKSWYKNGQLHIEHTCKDGKKDGLYKEWNENGQPNEESEYKNGKISGLCKKWGKNGKLLKECSYDDESKNGIYKGMYDNGIPHIEFSYKDDRKNELYLNLKREWNYDEKVELWLKFIFKDGQKDGIYKEWYKNGQLRYERTYKNNKLNGVYRAWYENGQLRYERNYQDGKKDDNYKLTDKNKQLQIITEYNNDPIIDSSRILDDIGNMLIVLENDN